MTYEDIIDWIEANGTFSADLFDTFAQWEKAVREDFKKHNHHFTPATSEMLAEYWENRYDTLADLSDEEAKDIENNKPSQYEKAFKRESEAHQFRARAQTAPREIVRRRGIAKSLSRELRRQRREARRTQERERFGRHLSRRERKKRLGRGR